MLKNLQHKFLKKKQNKRKSWY